jgi:CheY-like chemotaxis protein
VPAPLGAVLLVDAGGAAHRRLGGWLREAGYDVVVAHDGGEAVRLATAGQFELVVLDGELPDVDGVTVREQIKALSRHRTTPVVHLGLTGSRAPERPTQPYPVPDVYLPLTVERDEALATVRALLHQAGTHGALERLAARLGELAQVSVALGAATTMQDLLSSAAAWTARIFRCPAVVCAEDLDGRRVAVSTDGPRSSPRVLPWSRTPGGRSLGSGYVDEHPGLWPMVEWPPDDTVRVVVVRPRRDRPPVALAMPTSLADEGSPVLTQLGYVVAAGIEAVRAYDEERTLSLTLQRSLLPSRLPELPGIELAVRYVAASAQAEIGGDFYELSQVDERLLVAVGDVAGHSMHAATVMAELRHALRAYLVEGHPLAGTLALLNQLMLRLLPDEIATVCLASLDPVTGELRVANAGHPPPAICVDGDVRFLTGRSALLGIRAAHGVEVVDELPAGATLLLYTDGLIERRGENLQAGLVRLARAAQTVEKDLEAFCDRLLAEVNPASADDIAVVVLRRRMN